jgi:hypothetical protein
MVTESGSVSASGGSPDTYTLSAETFEKAKKKKKKKSIGAKASNIHTYLPLKGIH